MLGGLRLPAGRKGRQMTQPAARQLDVVTGAFSYSGAAIARELLRRGHHVRTLTGHPERAPGRIADRRAGRWTSRLGGADAIDARARTPSTTRTGCGSRTARSTTSSRWPTAGAVQAAAARRRPADRAHVDHPPEPDDSPYPYFRGKAAGRAGARRDCGVRTRSSARRSCSAATACSINNIAWLLRRLPVFAIGGARRLPDPRPSTSTTSPNSASDLGAVADRAVTVDAVGPESLTFRRWSAEIRDAVGSHAVIVSGPRRRDPGHGRALNLVAPGHAADR